MQETIESKQSALTIDIVSDAVCPWCFIGKRKLEAALANCPDISIAIHWRPYQLDATIPQGGISRHDYLTRKFGKERSDAMHARLTEAGQAVVIPFAFDKILRSPNTLNAHRLIRWAYEAGTQEQVVEQLFRAYFIEGGDIGDPSLLVAVAQANGLDAASVRERLTNGTDIEAVQGEIASAQQGGVTGVPFFIFANRYATSGAQPVDVLEAAIHQAASEATV